MIYDKPTKVLMKQFAEETLKAGVVFDRKDAVRWFEKNYPKIKANTVELHVEGMCINNGNFRRHHKQIKGPESGFDLFLKLGSGKYRLWDPTRDPAPVYGSEATSPEERGADAPEDVEDSDTEVPSKEFAFENDLRNYLVKNLDSLEKGLKLYQDEEFDGIEFPAGGRRIDILAVDARGAFVVIELKVSRGYDRVIGQIARYIGWVQTNMAAGKQVRGFIVASDVTEDLKLAATQIPGVKLVEYEISFKLRPL